ncbi:hypothetical protein GOODEAATRI_013925, partial [Goodea atripinnis]
LPSGPMRSQSSLWRVQASRSCLDKEPEKKRVALCLFHGDRLISSSTLVSAPLSIKAQPASLTPTPPFSQPPGAGELHTRT